MNFDDQFILSKIIMDNSEFIQEKISLEVIKWLHRFYVYLFHITFYLYDFHPSTMCESSYNVKEVSVMIKNYSVPKGNTYFYE